VSKSLPKHLRNKRDSDPALPREEWAMFKDCPEPEVHMCLAYEYARESKQIVKAVSAFGDHVRREPYADDVNGLAWCCGITWYLAGVLYAVRDAFPKSPWLSIPAGRRKSHTFASSTAHRAKRDWEKMQRSGGGVDVDNLKSPCIEDGKLVYRYSSHVDHVEDDGSPVTYFVHRVNWHKGDPLLVDEFREWLRHWRDVKPVERRGQTSPRDHLKALAAKRWLLLTAWNKAADITQEVLGKSLYVEQPAWIRAKRDAEDHLSQFTRTHVKHPAGRNIF
jgi:hypothetical protein